MASRWKNPGPFAKMSPQMGKLYQADKDAQRNRRANGRLSSGGTVADEARSLPFARNQASPVSPTQPKVFPTDEVKALRKQYRREKLRALARRHERLLRSLPRRSWDVRWLAYGLDWVSSILARMLHLYSDVRDFVTAHVGGKCYSRAALERLETCASCNGYYEKDGYGYCKGCNCGEWKGARIARKVWLAWWQCPEGKFGKERGIWLRWLRKEVSDGNANLG